MAARPERHETDKLTVVVIPGHGGSMFQWRVAPWALWTAVVMALAVIGGAAAVLARDLKQQHDLARASELKEANLKVALDLARGREALLRVASLEAQLRHMLKFKTEKALLKGSAVGGPSEEDVQKLAQLLDAEPETAVLHGRIVQRDGKGHVGRARRHAQVLEQRRKVGIGDFVVHDEAHIHRRAPPRHVGLGGQAVAAQARSRLVERDLVRPRQEPGRREP